MASAVVDHIPLAARPPHLSLDEAAGLAASSRGSGERVRLLGTSWIARLPLWTTAYGQSAGHPVDIAAPTDEPLAVQFAGLGGAPGPVVTAVCVEDVFDELRWDSSAPLDVPALQRLFKDSDRRIERFASELRDHLARHASRYVVVPPVFPPLPLPVAERSAAIRLARLAGRITDALVDALADLPHGSVLDTDRALDTLPRSAWAKDTGPRTVCPQLSEQAASLIARDLAPRLRLTWQPKVLVTDLDQTLWSGILSEDGADGVRSRAVEGEAEHHWWQRLLLCARAQGFIIAVCSKNSPGSLNAFTDSALRERRGLVITPDDFAAVSTEWTPKSEQLAAMARALDLPTDVFVLVDDNPVELAEVAAARPEITTLHFPGTGEGWLRMCRTLQDLTAVVDSPLTQEDRKRAQYYGLRYRSETARATARSTDEFLASLAMCLTLSPVAAEHSPDRCLQLLNRANRFHLTGHRYDEVSFKQLATRPGVEVFTGRLTDSFGDHGICAVIVVESTAEGVWLREFAMSCRVLNRTLETAVFDWLADRTRLPVSAVWHSTGRNDTVYEALRDRGFSVAARQGDATTLRIDHGERGAPSVQGHVEVRVAPGAEPGAGEEETR
jgi:FkbH-like protein